MPTRLKIPAEDYLLPRYRNRVVIPRASILTLLATPITIIPSIADEIPWLEIVTIEKLGSVAYSGSSSTQLIIDAVTPPNTSTTAFVLNDDLVLGITSGKSSFRNYGGNDVQAYANGNFSFGKFYRIRLGAGSEYSAGDGDVIVESFYSVVRRNSGFN